MPTAAPSAHNMLFSALKVQFYFHFVCLPTMAAGLLCLYDLGPFNRRTLVHTSRKKGHIPVFTTSYKALFRLNQAFWMITAVLFGGSAVSAILQIMKLLFNCAWFDELIS